MGLKGSMRMRSGTLGSETTSSSIRGQQRIQGMMRFPCFPVGQHWSPEEPGSGSSAKVNPSPMCSLFTCRSPWLRESVRIHGMEFYDLCGVLGRDAHLSEKREIFPLPAPTILEKTRCPKKSWSWNHPSHIIPTLFMIFSMNFLFLHVFPLVLISFLSISPKHPKFQALVKGRMTGAGSCWPCQGVRKPRKGTTQCLSTWQTNPSFGDEKNNTLQPKTACALLFLNNGRFLLFLLGHDMPQHLLLRRFLFFSLFF